jgi:alanine dehydrogenase
LLKVLTHKDIESLNIPPKTCLEWVTKAFKLKRSSQLPQKISLKFDDNKFYNVMPCIINDLNYAGIKIISRYPERSPSLNSQIMLFDKTTGEVMALLDGNWITAMRTGAIAALTVLTLAKKGFSSISIVGLGNTARATVDVLLSRLETKPLTIKLMKYKNEAQLFQDRYKYRYNNIKFEVYDSYETLFINSDVIISCVTYKDGVFAADEYFDEGVLVIPVHTRGFQNCDLFFDKVFVDDIEHVRGFRYFNEFKSVAELGDVLDQKVHGRESDNERIIAYNIGIALHDIFFASQIFLLLGSKGTKVNLYPPAGKIWL